MKASEARKIVEDYEAVSDISTILSEIEQAAREGRTNLKRSFWLRGGQIKELKKLGYNIVAGDHISW